MTPEARRKYFNLCDPNAPLDPDDPRVADIDLFGTDEGPVRGDAWVEDIAQDLINSNTPRCKLFTGLPGSGKSTLLRRLKRDLEHPPEPTTARFLCVLVNAEQWIDPSAPIDVPDILLTIVYETERAVLTAEGLDPAGAAHEGAVSRLWAWLSNTDVALEKFDASLAADVAIPAFAKLSTGTKAVIELKTNPSLRQQVRRAAEERMYTFLGKVREHLRELYRRAVARDYEGIVVVVDSLEKLRGIASNFEEVLESAERIFAQGAPYLHLADPTLGDEAPRIHAIYTVPPAMVLRRAIEVDFLPMIKLLDRKSGEAYEPGYKAARDLIRRRIPDALLADVFDATALEQRCRELITWSGGYPREIVRLLRECVKQTRVVDERLFRRLLSTAADAYRRTVTDDALPWLARVHRSRDRLQHTEDPKQRRLIDRALSDNLVLRYRNDSEWFDVHPALADMPALVAACEALDREPTAARTDG